MSREAADVARRAAEIIQERGICKGSFEHPDGRVCMYGALMEASGLKLALSIPLDIPDPIRVPITAALREMFPVPHHARDPLNSLPGSFNFNDLPETTERDVAKVLLQVADRLDVS